MNSHADLFEFEDDGLNVGFTTVQNLFITHFMPKAKGNHVKVYLAGLMRCYGGRTEQWASARTIAEEQGVSVDVVRAAWRYWESVGLIRRIPRYLRDPANPNDYRTEPDTEYCHQTTNVIRFRRNLNPLVEHSFGGVQNSTGGVCNSAQGGYAVLHTKERQDEELQVEERQDKTKGSSPVIDSSAEVSATSESAPTINEKRMRELFELHVGRKPSKSEMRDLLKLANRYGQDWVESACVEYMVQSDLQEVAVPIRYIQGVLENWTVEGMRMTDVVKHLKRLKEGVVT